MLSNQGVKKHFKMYKSGRLWMIAGIATAMMTLSYSPRVYGDTVSPTSNEVSTPKTGVDNNAKSAELKPVGSDSGVVNTASTQKDITTTSAQTSSGSLDQRSNIAKDSGTSPLSESANAVSQAPVTSADSLGSGSTEKAPSSEKTASSAADVNGLSESKQITGSSEGRISAESVQASQVNSGAVSATSVRSAKPSEVRQNIETASVSGNSAISKSDTSARDLSTVGKINRTQSAIRPMALNFLTTDDTEPIDHWMPNKTLQKIVLDELRTTGKEAGSQKTWSSVNDITQSDMLLLHSLWTQGYETYIDGKTSFSLEGLQYATNLTDLNFNRTMDSNSVDGNPIIQTRGDITDLSPLKNLVNLTTLELNGNRVSDITPIAGLKKITRLVFPNNNVADLSSLNAAQYTKGLYYSGQIIEQPLVRIPDTMTYTMVNPVKPAQGITYQYAAYKGIYFALQTAIASPNTYDTYRAFLNAGPSSFDGKSIKYQNIHVQVVPDQTPKYPTDHYLTNDLNVNLAQDFGTPSYIIQDNPKTYYMISQFFAPDGLVAATILTPYDVAPNAKDVTVKYVDETGSSIADDKTLSGLVGDPYTSEALSPVPADYELTTTPNNYKGTFSDKAQTVTYVYKKVNSTITIHYKDDKGNTIKDDTTSTGKIGTAFNLTHPDIDGYDYVSTTGTPSGKYTKDSAEVTFVYKVAQSTITVHYQDDKGNTIKPDTTSTGDIGSTFNLTHPDIDGYTYQSAKGVTSGKYAGTNAEVTFVYHVNEVVPPTTPETPVTPEQPATPGTSAKPETPTIAPTNNSSDPVNLDARQGTVTVKYVTDSGQQLAPTVVMTGKQGTSYITAPVAALSTVYQLEKIPENASGLYESNNQVVIYVYKIAAPVADNSTKPLAAIKTDSVETVHHERAGVVLPPRTSNYDLPKTNQKHAATSVIGFASLGFLFGGLTFSKRRKHD